MKPRLRFRDHVWICSGWLFSRSGKLYVMGHGYSPREAYDDWMDQV